MNTIFPGTFPETFLVRMCKLFRLQAVCCVHCWTPVATSGWMPYVVNPCVSHKKYVPKDKKAPNKCMQLCIACNYRNNKLVRFPKGTVTSNNYIKLVLSELTVLNTASLIQRGCSLELFVQCNFSSNRVTPGSRWTRWSQPKTWNADEQRDTRWEEMVPKVTILLGSASRGGWWLQLLQVADGVLHQTEPWCSRPEDETGQHGHICHGGNHVQVQVGDAREGRPVKAHPAGIHASTTLFQHLLPNLNKMIY